MIANTAIRSVLPLGTAPPTVNTTMQPYGAATSPVTGITVFYHGKDEIYISIKDFYENVRDLEPFECGGHLWNGYTCTSFGYPYTMLEAKDDGCVFQVMILMKNGEYEISFNDADVRSIIESISTCE